MYSFASGYSDSGYFGLYGQSGKEVAYRKVEIRDLVAPRPDARAARPRPARS